MKRAFLTGLISILAAGQALAGPYVRKPQSGFTANSMLVTGATSDSPTTVASFTESSGAQVLNGSSLTVNGATTMSSTLAVTGASTLSGALTVNANATVNGTLSLNAPATYTGSAIGTANTANGIVATITEGEGYSKITLDLDGVTIGTFDNGTNINGSTLNGAMGIPLFTFNDNGVFAVQVSSLDLEDVTCSTTNGSALTDTPDLGIGTALASSNVVSLLSSVTNGEDIHTGQTLSGINGETLDSTLVGLDFIIDTDAESDLNLNVADKYAVDLNGQTLKINNGSITFFAQYVYDKDHAD